jgi:hypothetical protein
MDSQIRYNQDIAMPVGSGPSGSVSCAFSPYPGIEGFPENLFCGLWAVGSPGNLDPQSKWWEESTHGRQPFEGTFAETGRGHALLVKKQT